MIQRSIRMEYHVFSKAISRHNINTAGKLIVWAGTANAQSEGMMAFEVMKPHAPTLV